MKKIILFLYCFIFSFIHAGLEYPNLSIPDIESMDNKSINISEEYKTGYFLSGSKKLQLNDILSNESGYKIVVTEKKPIIRTEDLLALGVGFAMDRSFMGDRFATMNMITSFAPMMINRYSDQNNMFMKGFSSGMLPYYLRTKDLTNNIKDEDGE